MALTETNTFNVKAHDKSYRKQYTNGTKRTERDVTADI